MVPPDPSASAPLSARLSRKPAVGGGEHLPVGWGHLFWLSLSAIGIVFGDIGTSPLYALRECFHGEHSVATSPENIFGVLSLVLWSLIIVVSVKYVAFVMQADNHGEGGVLALTALASPIQALSETARYWLVILGLFGAALLYGDGMITPAISVLSAVEGLNVATNAFEPYVILIAVVILVGLFLIQSHGTNIVGRLFGPVMVLWFVTIGVLGLTGLWQSPGILASFNPLYALAFFQDNGWRGFLVLGSVFLVATGSEALYADMGHFGRRPIRIGWFSLAMPALVLNYLGQGALLLVRPEAASNPFYQLAPAWALYPLVVLASCAAVIASQALISGAFSVTMQAAQLGFLPRLQIRHMSSTHFGQIYMPSVNWMLMIGCLLIVLGFGSSSRLAAAYGIAVTSTMAITTVIFYVVARELWKWSFWKAASITSLFLVVDLAFLCANLIKVPDGGWFPILIAVAIFTVMTTWKRGRAILGQRLQERSYPLQQFFLDIDKSLPTRVPGTAVFMSGSGDGVPPALMQNLEHNRVLHEHVVLLTVKTLPSPHIERARQVDVAELGRGFHRVTIYFGFMDEPDVPLALNHDREHEFRLDPNTASYFLGREMLQPSMRSGGMALWRERLFAVIARNATSPTAYFNLPPNRVVELGSHVEM